MATQAGAEPSAQSELRASAIEGTFTEVIEPNESTRSGTTGPRTPEGKAAVALNALKHGLATQALVLADEDGDALAALRAGLIADWAPVGDQETKLVERMVAAQWRTERVWRIETGVFRKMRASELLQEEEATPTLETVFVSGVANGNPLLHCQRYEAGYNREFHTCTRQLLLMQELRRKGLRTPGKRIADAQPLEVKPAEPRTLPAATPSGDTGSGKFTEQTPPPRLTPREAPVPRTTLAEMWGPQRRGFTPPEPDDELDDEDDELEDLQAVSVSPDTSTPEITKQTPAPRPAPTSAPFVWKHAGAGKVERQAFLGYRLPQRYNLRLPGSALATT